MNLPPSPSTTKLASTWSSNWTAKLLLIGFLGILLLIPSFWVQSLVDERQKNNRLAASEVHTMWGAKQQVGIPVVTLPYTYPCGTEKEPRQCWSNLHLAPKQAQAQISTESQIRHRGIFPVPLYTAKVEMALAFAEPEWKDIGIYPSQIDWEGARLSWFVADGRGLKETPTLRGPDFSVALANKTSSGTPWNLVAVVPNARKWIEEGATLHLQGSLNGSESFRILPFGGNVQATIQGDWPHPSFAGSFLPDTRSIAATGFTSSYSIGELAHGQLPLWYGGEKPVLSEYQLDEKGFGFDQLMLVDHYSLADRANKYSILFIALTFVLCFFAEAISKKRIHPLQYLLVGLSLLLFHMLLLSLSEQIGFAVAYGVSTLAVSLQIGLFLRSLLRSWKTMAIAITSLFALYGLLYILLQMEQMALLAGAIGLFTILGALMAVSTKIPWYDNGK